MPQASKYRITVIYWSLESKYVILINGSESGSGSLAFYQNLFRKTISSMLKNEKLNIKYRCYLQHIFSVLTKCPDRIKIRPDPC
jgi:hypothetical protein